MVLSLNSFVGVVCIKVVMFFDYFLFVVWNFIVVDCVKFFCIEVNVLLR